VARIPLALAVLFAALALAACGDSKPTPEEEARSALERALRGETPGLPGGLTPTGLPVGAGGSSGNPFGQAVELTDAMMQEYLDLSKELLARGRSGMPPLDLLAARGWDLGRWAFVSQQVALAATAHGAAGLSETAAKTEKRIAELEQKLASASDSQRPMLEAQLKAMQAQREGIAEGLKQLGGDADSPLMRKNREVLERWLPRLQAVRQER
jgi:hypothetical protein